MKIYARPEKNQNKDWFAEQSRQLLTEQKLSWQFLKNNYENLDNVSYKKFEFDGFEIVIQYNPDRITSSSADISNEGIKFRKCFLCTQNLPPEQKSLVYDKSFIILSNPYPIFREHFTISKKTHSSQTIIGNFEEMLNICRDLGAYYTIFYNGPKCGASAPDHMHLQAMTNNDIPVEYEYDKMINKLGPLVITNGKIKVRFFENHLRYFISLESQNKGELLFAFKTFVRAFKKISPVNEEPMMNIISSYQENLWRLIIFPRQRHRPSQFFADEDNRLLISPAAIDMGGLLITPRIEDFEKIKREDVINIFRQVTISKEYFEFLRKKIGEIFI
jgi:hypothetical protein